MFYDEDNSVWCVGAAQGEDESRWVQSLRKSESGSLYMLELGLPNADYITARFIAKIGLEILASKYLKIQGGNDEIVDKRELNELRKYVRSGSPNIIWPISIRQIYPPEFLFNDIQHGSHEVLHEFMIHHIPNLLGVEYYTVIAIFGVEYAINLGGPEIEGYRNWLKQNGNRSLLLGAVSQT